jgi:recombination protein RecA
MAKKEEVKGSVSKDKAYELLRQRLKKDYGQFALMQYTEDDKREEFSGLCLGTGCLGLDLALGKPIPRGRVVEIYGPESSGKTTLGTHILASALKTYPDERVGVVDVEHAYDMGYAQKLGVDTTKLDISQPDSGEQALDIMEMMVRSGIYSGILIDSVAALVPQAELEGGMGDQQMGLQARLMSKAMRKLVGPADRANVSLIFINQIRMKIGVMFGNPETTPGGNALKFYASQRLETRRTGFLKDGEDPYGITTRIKAVKNKVSAPFKSVEVDLIFGHGIDTTSDILGKAVELGIVDKAGAWYNYQDERLGQGKANVVSLLKEKPELLEELNTKVRSTVVL